MRFVTIVMHNVNQKATLTLESYNFLETWEFKRAPRAYNAQNRRHIAPMYPAVRK